MSSSIEFKLLAPYNKSAVLKGSFSDWQDIPMEKDDQGYFRTSVNLEDGMYQYQFRVQSLSWSHQPDEWININDAYATELDVKKRNGIMRIKDGDRILDDYVWQHDDQPLPDDAELVIYELLVSDFYREHGDRQGRYTDVIAKLDYLDDLGINAIELLPVNETPGDYNWGYTPSYFFAPKPEYGSTKDLKHLIDECHARGIRVILDQLYNHSSEESPLLHIDRDYWYYHDHHHPDRPNDYWGPEFNYDHYDENYGRFPAREFMGDVVRHWIHEYHIDGIRYDALKEIDHPEFMAWLTASAKHIAGGKPFYNVGEHIPDTPDVVSPNGPMDACWYESFYHTVRSHILGERFDLEDLKNALDPKRQGYPDSAVKVVRYLSNHDQNRLLAELGDRDILDDAAFKRAKLGAALLMTAVGIPLIWMGEEFGDATAITFDNQHQQLNWDLLKNDRNIQLWDYYKGLIALRKNHPALKTANINFFHENPEGKVLAFIRWNDEGARLITVVNLADQFLKDYQIPDIPVDGTWHEWTRDYDVTVQDGQLTVDLGEFEAQVFIGP